MNVFGVSASFLLVEGEEDEDEVVVQRRKNRRREDIASCGLLRKTSEVWFELRSEVH